MMELLSAWLENAKQARSYRQMWRLADEAANAAFLPQSLQRNARETAAALRAVIDLALAPAAQLGDLRQRFEALAADIREIENAPSQAFESHDSSNPIPRVDLMAPVTVLHRAACDLQLHDLRIVK